MGIINIEKEHILLFLKNHNKVNSSYELIPMITYSGKELFPTESINLFNEINDNGNYELIIIGNKLLKIQIDKIKSEILSRTNSNLNVITFEYDGIMNENISLHYNHYDIFLSGIYSTKEVIFKLHGKNWIEIDESV